LDIKNERDFRLSTTDWLVTRHNEEKLLGVSTTLTESQFTQLLNYRQALRNITTQYTVLADVVWPVNPIS